MSRIKNRKADTAAARAWDQARQAAAQVKPVAAQVKPLAAQVKPLAASTQAAAVRGVRSTRAWAAPRVERSGQVLADSIAPKVSAQLSLAARRLDPEQPRRSRWRKLVGISLLTAAVGVVVVVRGRRKPDVTTSADEADENNVAAAPETADGQASTGAKLT